MRQKARLKKVEEKVLPRRPKREIQLRFVFGDDDDDGHQNASRFDFEDDSQDKEDILTVRIVNTPEGPWKDRLEQVQKQNESKTKASSPDNNKNDMTAELQQKIKELERRKAELLKDKKP